jgi:type IV secretion system protein VirB6
MIDSAADFALFESIRSYISTRIDYFLESSLSNFFQIAGTIGLLLLTIWIMIQGFLIVTGRSQEGVQGFIYKAIKAYLIVAVATGVASTSGGLVRGLTDDLNDSISSAMTGNNDAAKCLKADAAFLGCKVDRAFTATQAITTFIGGIDTAGDPVLEDKKARASLFAGSGAAAPGIVAASMLLLYKFGMAMFVAFGPLFILCLLFNQTKAMFSKWLMYGIGLMFANAALAVVASISLDLVVNVSGALFVTSVLGIGSSGIMSLATQQLGLGLILSTLMISVPPMASNFFQGMVGSMTGQSLFTSWNAPMGGGAATSGNHTSAGANSVNTKGEVNTQAGNGGGNNGPGNASSPTANHANRVAGQSQGNLSQDAVKPAGTAALGNANQATPLSAQFAQPAGTATQSAGGTAAGTSSTSTTGAASNAGGVSSSVTQAPVNTASSQTASTLPSQALNPSKTSNTDIVKPRA